MLDCRKLSGMSEVLGVQLKQTEPDALVNCELMYRSKWRTEPFLASSLDAEDFAELESGLRFEAAAKTIGHRPDSMADERVIELWYEAVGEIAAELPAAISAETLIVELTNYKGEGEGLVVFDAAKHLPVFMSKQRSTELFCC